VLSDWPAVERGVSVSSARMSFERGLAFNLLERYAPSANISLTLDGMASPL
jgi:peptide subunit release factor RF-3